MASCDFEGIFLIDSISGNRKCIWVKDIKKQKKKVLLVGKKNIHLFKDNFNEIYIKREDRLDTYRDMEGNVILEVIRTPKDKTKKKNKKEKKHRLKKTSINKENKNVIK